MEPRILSGEALSADAMLAHAIDHLAKQVEDGKLRGGDIVNSVRILSAKRADIAVAFNKATVEIEFRAVRGFDKDVDAVEVQEQPRSSRCIHGFNNPIMCGVCAGKSSYVPDIRKSPKTHQPLIGRGGFTLDPNHEDTKALIAEVNASRPLLKCGTCGNETTFMDSFQVRTRQSIVKVFGKVSHYQRKVRICRDCALSGLPTIEQPRCKCGSWKVTKMPNEARFVPGIAVALKNVLKSRAETPEALAAGFLAEGKIWFCDRCLKLFLGAETVESNLIWIDPTDAARDDRFDVGTDD